MRTGFENLIKMLMKHEGIRLKPYRCTGNKLSIGVGRNLEDVGLTYDECIFLLANDVKRVTNEATTNFPWFKNLNIPRQDVVLNMLFNLGLSKFKDFKRMIMALTNQNYDKAADEMLSSEWSAQVGRRASELAAIMRTGIYTID